MHSSDIYRSCCFCNIFSSPSYFVAMELNTDVCDSDDDDELCILTIFPTLLHSEVSGLKTEERLKNTHSVYCFIEIRVAALIFLLDFFVSAFVHLK